MVMFGFQKLLMLHQANVILLIFVSRLPNLTIHLLYIFKKYSEVISGIKRRIMFLYLQLRVDLLNIVSILNGNLRTPKIRQLESLIQWLNTNADQNLACKPVNNSNLLVDGWLSGWIYRCRSSSLDVACVCFITVYFICVCMCYKTHTNTYKVHMNKTRDERGSAREICCRR